MKQITKNVDLVKDINEIYLGNLGTIDTDMSLPDTGQRGSHFKWQSDEHLFLSDTGKVTRPTPGVGNRVVRLNLTATLGTDTYQKQFDVTILQTLRKVNIDHPITQQLTVYSSDFDLPQVTVVQLEDGSYTTSTVLWDKSFNPQLTQQTIHGHLSENGMATKIVINTDLHPNTRHQNKFRESPVRLLGNNSFVTGYQSMLAHLRQVNLNQLLYNFKNAAGLPVNESDKMTGWDAPDCNLRGHTTGHYMSALAFAYFDSKDVIFKNKLDKLVNELAKCQEALANKGAHKGFLSAYDETQFDKLETFETYPNIWAPYYTLDKILSGLLDSYWYTNNQRALTVATGIGNWVSERLGKLTNRQLTKMWSIYIAGEFGGMISAMVRLYRYTENQNYLKTAELFSNDKLYTPMLMNYDTLNNMHANQHIPQIIGVLDLYQETNNPNYLKIAKNFWQIVVHHHIFANGGVGETEMFHEPDTISKYLTDKTDETCASYNMFKLSQKLFEITQDHHYMDYAENVLNNHLLVANDHTDAGASTYFLPLQPGGNKQYDTDVDNTCCHGSGLESMVRFQKNIYAYNGEDLYLNLLYNSEINVPEHGEIVQKLSDSQLTITSHLKQPLKLMIRIPEWFNPMVTTLDQDNIHNEIQDGYLSITLPIGDHQLEINFEKGISVKNAPDSGNLVSIFYGPDMMVAESDQEDFIKLATVHFDQNTIALNHRPLVPFNQVRDQHYHAYFKR